MSTQLIEPNIAAIRFHLCLNVSNLTASIEFFTAFFGVNPAKVRDDYAKFETDNPPLVLSLEPTRPGSGGVLNHVGLRMPDAAALVAMQRRLESIGIKTTREEGVECCYAKQTKFWLFDPDGTLWEVYTLDEDIEHRGFGEQVESGSESHLPSQLPVIAVTPSSPVQTSPASIWSHRLGQPFPSRLFVEPDSVDEIRLQGTFNMTCTHEQRTALLKACLAALRVGGTLHTHQLTSDQEIASELLNLDGAAAVVQAVLPIEKLTAELENAGFVNLRFLRFPNEPTFRQQQIELRESILVGSKPAAPGREKLTHRMLYKGPASELILDDGTKLRRGRFVSVTESNAVAISSQFSDCVAVDPPA